MSDTSCSRLARSGVLVVALLLSCLAAAPAVGAAQPQAAEAAAVPQPAPRPAGGEANLVLPDLELVDFQGVSGRTLLTGGLAV